MNSSNTNVDFSTLKSDVQSTALFRQLNELTDNKQHLPRSSMFKIDENLEVLKNEWQKLCNHQRSDNHPTQTLIESREKANSDWLIKLFNTLFAEQNVILARSNDDPEYFPAKNNQPARIEFAHGFFQSALHEISHFCVAGEQRRQLADFGYWYAPDGRTEAQQQAFERVEIKPQALECLFTLACGRNFQVSQDNLFADFDTSGSTFGYDVYSQVKAYIAAPHTLPRDAKILLKTLLRVCWQNEANIL